MSEADQICVIAECEFLSIVRKQWPVKGALCLTKMNYDDLGYGKLGRAFLIVTAALISSAYQAEPAAGIIPLIIYVAAWVHTNTILSKKQRLAKAQFLLEKRREIA